MQIFSAEIFIIGINPYVEVPEDVLAELFKAAGKEKGPIPIKGQINGKKFIQNIVKYQGLWRLYLNTPMRKDAQAEVGDTVRFEIAFDPVPRTEPAHPAFIRALSQSKEAKSAFEKLAPSHQKEIHRSIRMLKSEKSRLRNIGIIIQHLLGNKPETLYALMHKKRDETDL
ncbi:DUF1905 domain-containing protein [Glaciimonas soli]|uniref:DUF1905 domain-containing protein n=1 Tax=Glaciimonas soli TaxID=2590999 RepID=A0A843YV54_9BURK|nr:DUF1905 domain-containing protein [Glaciimonas soli]MQR01378.1 DUF1905 domain-containing protein [Glaciimonas soli]